MALLFGNSGIATRITGLVYYTLARPQVLSNSGNKIFKFEIFQ